MRMTQNLFFHARNAVSATTKAIVKVTPAVTAFVHKEIADAKLGLAGERTYNLNKLEAELVELNGFLEGYTDEMPIKDQMEDPTVQKKIARVEELNHIIKHFNS
jgi:hypothetical protein